MSEDDVAYFTRRARQEFAAAHRTKHPQAAVAHLLLAERYVDAIYAGLPAAHITPRLPPLGQGMSAFG